MSMKVIVLCMLFIFVYTGCTQKWWQTKFQFFFKLTPYIFLNICILWAILNTFCVTYPTPKLFFIYTLYQLQHLDRTFKQKWYVLFSLSIPYQKILTGRTSTSGQTGI